ncbi:MAG: NUDIX domain-containing protein [Parcubacteria group bacterium]
MAKIIIVNEQDEIIGSKERDSVIRDDIYRVSALWIENSKGEVLLAQRSFNKSHSPGKWGSAVSGTNDEGETYDSNIVKEAEEEIGLSGIEFEKAQKVRVSRTYNYFCQWYKIVLDRGLNEFKIEPKEVEAIRWFSRDELKKAIEAEPGKFISAIKNFVK